MMNIELYKYSNGIFMHISHGIYTQILNHEGICFGKLTAINFKKYCKHLKIKSLDQLNPKYKEWWEYLNNNINRFRIIWVTDSRDTRYKNIYPGKLYDGTLASWNLVCHHIGYFRRYGSRSYNDSFKLGVAGLNTQIFRKIKNIKYEKINKSI